MHRIEETPYGYRLVVEDFLGPQEADSLLSGVKATVRSPGGLLIDLRRSRTLHPDAQEALRLALLHCHGAGIERAACALDSAIVLLQTRRLVREAGLEDVVRLLDVSHEPEWETMALAWIERGI
ncbi:MAG TPA: hypothetical protein VG477_15700 [Thermoanaerobaculia bacterium]|nr:hypothetical protein [Thermoanaerobaculia bacterium]